MGDANTLNLDPEREKALSDQLAQQALAEQKSDEDLLSTIVEIGGKIVESVKTGLDKTWQVSKDTYDELSSVGDSLEEKMDDVVGFIVDPIRKSISALGGDLTKGLDPALGAGLVVGAVYSMRDQIKQGFDILWNDTELALELLGEVVVDALKEGWEYLKALWPYMEEGLLKLGDVITTALDMGWEFIKSIAPSVLEGMADIGLWVWERTPDWLKTGLEFVHDVYTTMLKIPADIAGYIGDALGEVLKFMGLDTLGEVVSDVGDVLHGIADWLGLTTEDETAPAKRGLEQGASNVAAMEEAIAAGGGPAASVYRGARDLGLTSGQAAHLSALADTNAAATQAAMIALQKAVTSGMDPTKAYELAFAEFKRNYGGTSKSRWIEPAAPEVAAGGMSGVAADRAAEIAAAKETNATLKRMVALQEHAEARAASGTRTSGEMIDTVSSDDELSAFSTGRVGGGTI